MHVNDLPDNVLEKVLQLALFPHGSGVSEERTRTVLLTVCSRWHNVAVPLAYGTVFVRCGTLCEKLEDGPVDVETMVDPLAKASRVHMVKHLVVDVYYRVDPFPQLKAVVAKLRGVAVEWTGVRKLELSLHGDSESPIELALRVADHEDSIDHVCAELAALLPGLREITFGNRDKSQVARVLCGRLVGCYADKLQVLRSAHSLVVPQDRVFSQLKSVAMDSIFEYPREYLLPQLNPEAIECLAMHGFAASKVWSMFGADGRTICFPRLHSLDMNYSLDREVGSDQQPEGLSVLQFPALQRLRVACPDEGCPLLDTAEFPRRLELLSLRTGLALSQTFARLGIQVARRLTLNFDYDSGRDWAAATAANRILDSAGSCEAKSLAISGTVAVSAKLLAQHRLTELQLYAPISVGDLIEVIRGQPQLEHLLTCRIVPNEIQTDLSIPTSAERVPGAPLDTQLRSLSISYHATQLPSEAAVQVVKYLLLRIPTLEDVLLVITPGQPIIDFVDEYKEVYPHLANVKLEVKANPFSATSLSTAP